MSELQNTATMPGLDNGRAIPLADDQQPVEQVEQKVRLQEGKEDIKVNEQPTHDDVEEGAASKPENDQPTHDDTEEGAVCKPENDQEAVSKFQEIVESELQCPICKETYIQPLNLSCEHTVCRQCLKHWKRSTDYRYLRCPVCRKRVFYVKRAIVLEQFITAFVEASSPEYIQKRKDLIEEREEGDGDTDDEDTEEDNAVDMPLINAIILGRILGNMGFGSIN